LNVIRRIIPYEKTTDSFNIALTGDFHIGYKTIEWHELDRVLKWIKDHGNYWVGMGDYAQAVVPSPSERRFDFDELDLRYIDPKTQYAKVEELLTPIADKGLMLLTGNHDDKLRKVHYHDYVDSLGLKLDIPYAGISGFLRLVFKRGANMSKLDMYCHHGYFGGRTKGGKIKRVTELANIFEADVYAMGHVHGIDHTTTVKLIVDKGCHVKEKIRHFLVTGGFIRGYVEEMGTYIEKKMYTPTRLGSLALRYWPEHRKVEVVEI